MSTKDIISRQNGSHIEKMRSQAEILARYNLDCEKYKTMRNSEGEIQDQLLMLYTELKLLGWILGKNEQTIVHDAHF